MRATTPRMIVEKRDDTNSIAANQSPWDFARADGLAQSGVGRMIIPSLLTLGSVLSIVWWRASLSADKQLMKKLLTRSQEWKEGVVTSRITYIGGRERDLQKLAWSMNDIMDQVETAQVDMRFSLAYVTWGDFSRKSYPEGLHGGFARALKELNLVTDMLSKLTNTISDLMQA
jgi:methyl-accepting chemotaxis protein